MQSILTQLFVFIAIVSIAFLVTNFVCSVPRTPQSIVVVESLVESIIPVVQSPVVPSVSSIVYATLEWVHQVTEEAINEMPDIVVIARQRMPQVDLAPLHSFKSQPTVTATIDITSLGIRDLKKLASDRKLKGYSNMRKAELIAALC